LVETADRTTGQPLRTQMRTRASEEFADALCKAIEDIRAA
jgi:hypothetical protein